MTAPPTTALLARSDFAFTRERSCNILPVHAASGLMMRQMSRWFSQHWGLCSVSS